MANSKKCCRAEKILMTTEENPLTVLRSGPDDTAIVTLSWSGMALINAEMNEVTGDLQKAKSKCIT